MFTEMFFIYSEAFIYFVRHCLIEMYRKLRWIQKRKNESSKYII